MPGRKTIFKIRFFYIFKVLSFRIHIYFMSIEIYVYYSAEIKFVFHCILYFSHVKKVV